MSNSIFNKAGIMTLAAAGVMLVTAANGASAHGFGGGNSGHGGFNGGGVHYDHIVVRGGRDNDHGGGYDRGADNRRGGYDRSSNDNPRGSYNRGSEYNHGMAGNTGVYCPSCAGPVQIGNRPNVNTQADGTSHLPPRPQTRPTTPAGGGVQPTSSRSPELPPGASSRVLGRSSTDGTIDNTNHTPRDIGHPHTKPSSSDL